MPEIIANSHDRFIIKFFETARHKVIERKWRSFGLAADGYLIILDIMVKIYPRINNHILFVGLV